MVMIRNEIKHSKREREERERERERSNVRK